MVNRVYVNVGDGKKATMARYYKNKMYSDEERKLIAETGMERMLDSQFDEVVKNADDKNYYSNRREAVKAAYKKQISKNKNDKL